MHFSNNEVCVEGILQEVELITGNDKNNKPFIRGHVIVNVDQSYAGNDEHEEVKVSFYSGKYTNDGRDNPAYKSIEGLANYKRISVDGDMADGIRFTRGTIGEYAFKPQGGDSVVTGWQINNSFFTKVPSVNVKPQAVFKNEIFIREITDEVDNSGEVTGRLKIVGILVTGYKDVANANVITYYVEDKQAIDYISKNWSEGDTVNVGGRIRSCVEMAEAAPKESAGFGDEIAIGGARNRRELIITTGSPSSVDEDMSFDEDVIRTLMGERMNKINAAASAGTKKASTGSSAAKRSTRGW